jgi:tRNA U55 pseudouridine synthase TruB
VSLGNLRITVHYQSLLKVNSNIISPCSKGVARNCLKNEHLKLCISALGSCAHVSKLHRFQHGPFTEQDMLDSNEWTMQNILIAIQKAKGTYGAFLKRPRIKHKYELSLSR